MEEPINAQTLRNVRFIGSLHNGDEIDAACGLPAGAGPTDRIEAAWRQWGTEMPSHLTGDWSLVIGTAEETFLARDPVGMKPLFYRIDGNRLHHGFSVAELRRDTDGPATPDPDWMARYLLGLSLSHDRTAYHEIRRLPPGHWLLHRPGQVPRLVRYHHWRDDAPDARRRDPAHVAAYRSALEQAIRRRMMPQGVMGVEISGGMDTSTLLAFLARFTDDPDARLSGFSYAMLEQERACIAESVKAAGISRVFLIDNPMANRIDDAAMLFGSRTLGQPAEHANATGHVPFYEECRRQGITTLYSGFGGDEVVTGSGALLHWELADKRRLLALMQIKSGSLPMRALRALKGAVLPRRKPPFHPAIRQAYERRWPTLFVRDAVVERLALREAFMQSAAYDGPYRAINDFIIGHQLQHPNLAIRMENCTIIAAAYGVDYRWPLLDAQLVQHYLSTPSIEKYGPHGTTRYLHRRAIDGIVPDSIAWKPSKSMGGLIAGGQEQIMSMTLAAARRHEAHLHPALDPIIDRGKLRGLIDRARHGPSTLEFTIAFLLNINALRELNLWLHDDLLPE